MANTRGFEVVAQVTVDVLRQIYHDAWKNGGDGSGEGVLPQRITLGAGLAFGPYRLKDGEIVIPEAGLGLDMDVPINGIAARMVLQVSAEIDNPPIPSASLFSLDAEVTIRAPVEVLDPATNKVGLRLSGLPPGAIAATVTSGDSIGPIANDAVAEYVHALYVDEASAFPRRVEDVPINAPPFTMKADMEIFDDSTDPARRITVAGPTAGKVTLRLPCRLRFYDIEGEAFGGDGAIALARRPTHIYGNSGLYVAKLRVAVQQSGGSTTRHFAAVDVANVAPSVTAPPAIMVNEGETFEVIASFTDPEWLDRHTAIFDFGDNTKPVYTGVAETNQSPRAEGTARASHAYCQSGTYRIRVWILDDDGGIGEAVVAVRVHNVAHTVHLPARVRTLVDQPIRLIGRFTDPGWCDRHEGIWAFGDCSEQWAVIREIHQPPEGRGTAEAVHVYRCCGVHMARLTVRDQDGAEGRAELRVEAVRLNNPWFEDGFHLRRDGREESLIANGGAPFAAAWPMTDPKLAGTAQDVAFRPDLFVVADGRRGQAITVRGAIIAGIMQRVPVNCGWLYEFEGRYDLPAGELAGAMLGLDPRGGTDPLSTEIVWAEGPAVHDWASLAGRVEAAADDITLLVGLRSRSANASLIRWDSTHLVQLQPLCVEEKCVPTRIDMGTLAVDRLIEAPVVLEGSGSSP